MPNSDRHWFVYILECHSGKLYTGATPNVPERMLKHLTGKGAMFTRLNRPQRLLGVMRFESKSLALRAESKVKKYPVAGKQLLAATWRNQYPLNELGELPLPIYQ